MKRNDIPAHAALSAAALIYGANYLIAKSVMPDPIGPNEFIVLRVAGASILFWLVAFRKISFPHIEDWWRFVLCSVCGVATNQLFFFNGLSLTSPINASIIMTSNPIAVMLISAWLLNQKISRLKLVGVMLGSLGAVFLLFLSSIDKQGNSSWQGDMCILINSISWAFYLVLVKPLMERYHPLAIAAWVFLIGILLVLPFGGMGIKSIDWRGLSQGQWLSMLYVIVCTTFLTYLCNMIGVHYLSPTTASAYIYFQPLLAGVFAYIFSGICHKDYSADITWQKVFCTLLVFAGVYMVSKSDKTIA